MRAVLDHVRRNVVAYIALFVALGGTSYATFSLPAGSVGAKQIRNHSITPIKFDRGSIGAVVMRWAVIKDGTQVVASRPRGAKVAWDSNNDSGVVTWGGGPPGNPRHPVPTGCFPLATAGGDFVQVNTVPFTAPHRAGGQVVQFNTYSPAGEHDPAPVVYLAILCPQP